MTDEAGNSAAYEAASLTLDDDGLKPYLQIFANNDNPRQPGVLEWRYLDNPWKRHSVVEVALAGPGHSSRLAGIYAVMGVPFRLGSQQCAAVQSLDTLTDQNHRKKGIFNYLAEIVYEKAAKSGAELVYGFPNGSSNGVFISKLGWSQIDPLPILAKPLRTGIAVSKLLKLKPNSRLAKILDIPLGFGKFTGAKDIKIEDIDIFDAVHDRIWNSFSSDIYACVERKSEYMNWRIKTNPAKSKYKCKRVTAAAGRAEMIWCIENKHGGRIGYIMDWIWEAGAEKAASAAMKYAIADMREEGADIVLAWSTEKSPNRVLYGRSGFWNLPERLRPIELHWGFRQFGDTKDTEVHKRDNWYISFLDSDTV